MYFHVVYGGGRRRYGGRYEGVGRNSLFRVPSIFFFPDGVSLLTFPFPTEPNLSIFPFVFYLSIHLELNFNNIINNFTTISLFLSNS